MSGWGNDDWGGGEYFDNQRWQGSQGMSAASYNFHRTNNNKQASHQYGGQKWEYNPPSNMPWSTAADDEDSYNQQPWPSDFGHQGPQGNPPSSMLNQEPPVGWRNNGNMLGPAFQKQSFGPPNFRGRNNNRPPHRPIDNGGLNQGFGRGGGNQMWQGQRGHQDDQPARKRPRAWRGAGGRHQQQQWEEGGGYGYNQGGYGDEGQWNEGGGQGQGSGWNEEEEYYYENQGYSDWSQIPPSNQPSTWEGQAEGYEDDAYTTQFDYGEGYEGGYEDPDSYYDSAWGRGKRMRPGKASRELEKTHVKDLPEDKIVYKKIRELAKDRDGRDFLLRTMKSTMHAMREASNAMSLELKELLNPTPKEDLKDKQDTTDGVSTTESKECEKAAGNENETEATAEGQDAANATKEAEATKEVVEAVAADGESKKETTNNGAKENGEKTKDKELPPQVLIGVVRVGAAVRRILSKENPQHGAELIAVFNCKPTKSHMVRLSELIKEKMHPSLLKKLNINFDEAEEAIEITPVSETGANFPIVIRFTSPHYGDDYVPDENEKPEENDPEDLLDEAMCIKALAKIRRVRWALKKHGNELEKPIVRLFLDITTRLPGWKFLRPYPTEVLVHTVMEKLSKDVRESELHISRLFIQCLEVLAEGLVLPGGPGLKDPCESRPTDVFAYLTRQQAEDLTKAAQHALRMAACERLYELINSEP